MPMSELNKKEKLIHSMIFSGEKNFRVNLNEYVQQHDREQFCRDIRKAVILSGLEIVYNGISVEEEDTYWKITLQ
jgi:hypothetical protein